MSAQDNEDVTWIEFDALEQQECHQVSTPLFIDDLFREPDSLDTFFFEWNIALPCNNGELLPFQNEEDDENSKTKLQVSLTGYKTELGQTLPSTGLTVWLASHLLSDYMVLRQAEICSKKSILELGAGLGLCGIVAAKLGAQRVVMTDGDSATLAFMRSNVRLNFGGTTSITEGSGEIGENERHCSKTTTLHSPECHQLIWQRVKHNCLHFTAGQDGGFSLVLGADICYVEQNLDALWNTINQLLALNGQVWLAYTVRNVGIDTILMVAQRHGFICSNVNANTNAGTKEGIYIFVREPMEK